MPESDNYTTIFGFVFLGFVGLYCYKYINTTDEPVDKPTIKPTNEPVDKPTIKPTNEPVDKPTIKPTNEPTIKPTNEPTIKPIYKPTIKPIYNPIYKPIYKPTYKPTYNVLNDSFFNNYRIRYELDNIETIQSNKLDNSELIQLNDSVELVELANIVKPTELAKPTKPTDLAEPVQIQRKFAIIFGVSDYKNKDIPDLQYCDEDVITWYNLLKSQGYEIHVFSDESNREDIARKINIDLKLIQHATKNNIFERINQLYMKIQANRERDLIGNMSDYKFAFISSGHGSIYDKDNEGSLLLTYDQDYNTNTEANKKKMDYICDYELKEQLAPLLELDTKVICILDNCHTGGFIDDLTSNSIDNIAIIAASTFQGEGYDNPIYRNGMLTYYLTSTINQAKLINAPLGTIFEMASNRYNPIKSVDKFQFGGNREITF